MKRYMFIACALTLFLIPGISSAQMQGGGKGKGMGGQQRGSGRKSRVERVAMSP